MRSKLIMIGSALFLAIAGLLLTFVPQEIANTLQAPSQHIAIVALQLLGALYLGFAILNFMTRNTIIGGIYGRPLVLANLLHFGVGYFALRGLNSETVSHFVWLKAFTLIYVIIAFAFAYLLATHPSQIKKQNTLDD